MEMIFNAVKYIFYFGVACVPVLIVLIVTRNKLRQKQNSGTKPPVVFVPVSNQVNVVDVLTEIFKECKLIYVENVEVEQPSADPRVKTRQKIQVPHYPKLKSRLIKNNNEEFEITGVALRDGYFELTIHESLIGRAMKLEAKHLMSLLNERLPDIFPTKELAEVVQTDLPYVLHFFPMSSVVKERQYREKLLDKASLYDQGSDGVKLYPTYYWEDGDLFFNCSNGAILTVNKFRAAFSVLESIFHGKHFVDVKPNGQVFQLITVKPKTLPFSPGEKWILEKDGVKCLHPGIQTIVDAMRDDFKQTRFLSWCLGMNRSGSFFYKDFVIVSMNVVPHFMSLGETSSGKTFTMKAIAALLKLAYGKCVDLYFISPKEDFINYSDKASDFKQALIDDEDSMIDVMNIFNHVMKEIKRRKEMLNKLKNNGHPNCANIADMRLATGLLIPDIVIVMDEFAQLNKLGIGMKENANIENTVAYMVDSILAVYRYLGVHLVIGTQEARQETGSLTSRMKTNIVSYLVHRAKTADTNYVECFITPANNFEARGDCIGVKIPDIKCAMTGADQIPLALPFIGADETAVLDYIMDHEDDFDWRIPQPQGAASDDEEDAVEVEDRKRTHHEFDKSLIYSKGGKGGDMSNLTPADLYKRIDKYMFGLAGFERTELLVENTTLINSKIVSAIYVNKDYEHMKFAFGLLDSGECEHVSEMETNEVADFFIFFTRNKPSKSEEDHINSLPANYIFVRPLNYEKWLDIEIKKFNSDIESDMPILKTIKKRISKIQYDLEHPVMEMAEDPKSKKKSKKPSGPTELT